MGWVFNAKPHPLYSGKDPVPVVQEVGYDPGHFWTGVEYLLPTWIRLPDRPARSESLYRLTYSGPHIVYKSSIFRILANLQHFTNNHRETVAPVMK